MSLAIKFPSSAINFLSLAIKFPCRAIDLILDLCNQIPEFSDCLRSRALNKSEEEILRLAEAIRLEEIRTLEEEIRRVEEGRGPLEQSPSRGSSPVSDSASTVFTSRDSRHVVSPDDAQSAAHPDFASTVPLRTDG